MESRHVSKFSKALAGQSNKDGKLTGTGEIKYKNAQNKITDDDFEESIVTKDSDNYKFDLFAEALQDIVIEDSFEKMQNDFCEKYYKIFEEKNNNNIIIKSDSIEDSLDYSENMNKMLDDNYDNENGIKNNVNNYTCLNLEENLKKKEINNESEFNDNDYNNNNLDLFAFIGNNINNNNFYSLYNRDEIDERFDKYKKCPKLELDYKQ